MEYKKANPEGLLFKWIVFAAFIIFALVAFIRYRRQRVAEIEKPDS